MTAPTNNGNGIFYNLVLVTFIVPRRNTLDIVISFFEIKRKVSKMNLH